MRLNRGGIFCDDEVSIRKTAIHTKGTYNPRAWNKYPEVTPPEGVWMRCEGHDDNTGRPFRALARYTSSGFCFDYPDTPNYPNTPDAPIRRRIFPAMVIDRFRPWDDEEDGK